MTTRSANIHAALGTLYYAASLQHLIAVVPAAIPYLEAAAAEAARAHAAQQAASDSLDVVLAKTGVSRMAVADGSALTKYGPEKALPVLQAAADAQAASRLAQTTHKALDAALASALDQPDVREGIAAFLSAQADAIAEHAAAIDSATSAVDALMAVTRKSSSVRDALRTATLPNTFTGGRTPSAADHATKARAHASALFSVSA